MNCVLRMPFQGNCPSVWPICKTKRRFQTRVVASQGGVFTKVTERFAARGAPLPYGAFVGILIMWARGHVVLAALCLLDIEH